MVPRNITLDLNKTSIQLTLLITVIGVIVIITDHDIKSLQLLCVVDYDTSQARWLITTTNTLHLCLQDLSVPWRHPAPVGLVPRSQHVPLRRPLLASAHLWRTSVETRSPPAQERNTSPMVNGAV